MLDGDLEVIAAVDQLDPPLFISATTRIELENGVWRESKHAPLRRRALDILLENVTTLDFRAKDIAAYQSILAVTGFSRRKMVDRMTASIALVAGLPLITFNGRDFRDVPGLELIEWTRPAE